MINDKRQTTIKLKEDARYISDFLNNEIPDNTSVLVTSRERSSNFGNRERHIDLAGLHKQESIELFVGLITDDYLKETENIKNNSTVQTALDKIINMTGGHPLSIEIIAKNTSSIYDISEMADTLALGIINPDKPEKRLQSLEVCFGYTMNRLSKNIKKLLYMLTLFKSPFPIYVSKKVFNKNIKFIIDLHEQGLLLEIKSESSFEEINDAQYWVYDIHPAIRNYLEKTMIKEIKKNCQNLKKEYGKKFYKYYYELLYDTETFIGKEYAHVYITARFNRIYNQGENSNDFDRSITFAKQNNDLLYCMRICRKLGVILKYLGVFSKALVYFEKSATFNKKQNDIEKLAGDYGNIGVVYKDMGKYTKALEYHQKALKIDKCLNNRIGIVQDCNNIGTTYRKFGEYTKALEYHQKAFDIYKDMDDRMGLSTHHNNIGLVYHDMKDYHKALEHFEESLKLKNEFNNSGNLSITYHNMGRLYHDMKDYHKALEHFEESLQIEKKLHNISEVARNYYEMSLPLYAIDKKKDALESLYTAREQLIKFEKNTGYRHPLLKDVVDRISFIGHINNKSYNKKY